MAFAESFAEFFNTDDFAVTASYTPSGGSATTITGIFDAEYVAVDGDGSVSIASNTPIFQCPSSNVPSPYNATLVVNGITYRVVEFKPDGTGVTTLILEEQG